MEHTKANNDSVSRTETASIRLTGKIANLGWQDATVDMGFGVYDSNGSLVAAKVVKTGVSLPQNTFVIGLNAPAVDLSQLEPGSYTIYPINFVRNCNQFLAGLRDTKVLTESEKAPLEGEVRFLRAWCYFNMVRSLGGVPLMGDSVYSYNGPGDINSLRKPRATEAACYDYIISECKAAAGKLSAQTNTHSARANRWAAEMLEARAAVYAGSLANYNNKMTSPIRTAGGEVGIPADKAAGYYQTALAAAKDVIENSPYKLQDDPSATKGVNFYNAVCIKDNNTEVIWARDYKKPTSTVSFSNQNVPSQFKDDIDNSYAGPTLNMVEQFEPLNTTIPGLRAAFKTKNADGSYVFYNSSSAPFDARDPRLYGSIIYPGGKFRNTPCVLQAGQLVLNGGKWEIKTGALN